MGFLRRGVNKGLVEVMGATVNRGAGYGLPVRYVGHCAYAFGDWTSVCYTE